MAFFLYLVAFVMIFLCGFGLPFATRQKGTAIVLFVSGVALFFGGMWLSEVARQGPPLNFLAVLCLSVLPFAAGSLPRLVTLYAFGEKANAIGPVAAIGAVATLIYGGLGYMLFGLVG